MVDYIKELQQVLQSLEAKKQRKLCGDVLSPRPASTPRLPPYSPIKPLPFSPKLGFPISPRTPLPESPYKCNTSASYISNKLMLPAQTAYPFSENGNNNGTGLELSTASSTAPAMADVTVEFSGPNVLLKTISQRIPGQVLKIIAALEKLSLEILHASVSTVDSTLLNSFTIKVNITLLFLLVRVPYYMNLKQNVKTWKDKNIFGTLSPARNIKISPGDPKCDRFEGMKMEYTNEKRSIFLLS